MQGKNNSHWVRCPICNRKTRLKVFFHTVLLNLPLHCPKCKRETIVDIIELKTRRL